MSSCTEQGIDEYDVCQVDDSIWNFATSLAEGVGCASVRTSLLAHPPRPKLLYSSHSRPKTPLFNEFLRVKEKY